jgi:hypothetical protein
LDYMERQKRDDGTKYDTSKQSRISSHSQELTKKVLKRKRSAAMRGETRLEESRRRQAEEDGGGWRRMEAD